MAQQINLLEPALLPKREWCTGRSVLVTAGLLGGAVVAHYSHENMALKRALASAAPAPSTAASTGTQGEPVDIQMRDSQLRLARSETLMKAVGALTDLPRDNARRMKTLFAAMPETVWLQEVEFSSERSVRIVGGATEPSALTGFSQRLGAAQAFHGLPLHVYALQPREAEPGAALPVDAAPAGDASAERGTATPAPTLYGFVLSSVDAEVATKAAQ
jgi:hypothetical protein